MRRTTKEWESFAAGVGDVVAVRQCAVEALTERSEPVFEFGIGQKEPQAQRLLQHGAVAAVDLGTAVTVLDQLAFIRVHDYFSMYVVDVAEAVLRAKPALAHKLPVRFEAARAFEVDTLEELQEELRMQQVDTVRRTSSARILKFLLDSSNLALDQELIRSYTELRQLRNLLVHAGGSILKASGFGEWLAEPPTVDFVTCVETCVTMSNWVDKGLLLAIPNLPLARVDPDEEYILDQLWRDLWTHPGD